MANVVIVSKHMLYYNNDCTDTSFAVPVSDILAFSNMEKAIEYVEKQIKEVYFDEPKFDRFDYSDVECIYQGVREMIVFSQHLYNQNGIRHAFRIVKQKIE